MLKLKINVNVPQLLCIVISVAENNELERFGGFSVDCYYTFITFVLVPCGRVSDFTAVLILFLLS